MTKGFRNPLQMNLEQLCVNARSFMQGRTRDLCIRADYNGNPFYGFRSHRQFIPEGQPLKK